MKAFRAPPLLVFGLSALGFAEHSPPAPLRHIPAEKLTVGIKGPWLRDLVEGGTFDLSFMKLDPKDDAAWNFIAKHNLRYEDVTEMAADYRKMIGSAWPVAREMDAEAFEREKRRRERSPVFEARAKAIERAFKKADLGPMPLEQSTESNKFQIRVALEHQKIFNLSPAELLKMVERWRKETNVSFLGVLGRDTTVYPPLEMFDWRAYDQILAPCAASPLRPVVA